ncbi:MAG: UDP-N-acetylmuramoyl-tripeptide--D-alanyl-D-alanine ligase [Syntrophomonas sp.]|nr:UDP-N-acetylmuramoyl-tripeptide--D-alanyl-D-alanine ligase [Syntrophomonas sp.]
MQLSLDFILDSTNGTLLKGNSVGWAEGVSTDSRRLKPGQLFFALEGDNFDGHDYIDQVLRAGAAAVIISQAEKVPAAQYEGAVILVKDTLEALQQLAGRYRQLFNIPIVAVTGSVGKTTTKDILADCLAPVYRTLKTPGNYNNEIGLPLTLMSMGKEHQAAVVELAMRAPGEIAHLADIVKPTYAIITNIEPVHLETMVSLENIARAKCEVLEFVAPDKFALINGDNEILLREAQGYPNPKYTFGNNNNCDIQVVSIEKAGSGINVAMRLWDKKDIFYLPLPARKLAANMAAAVGCARLMGVSLEIIKESLGNYRPSDNRLNIINLPAGGAVIDDTYNANPVSMMAALEVCQDISSGRKTVAVLGDMLELGDYEIEGHLQVGKRVAELNVDMLVTIGERAAYIGQGALLNGMPADRIKHYRNRADSLPWLKDYVRQQDVVLFKGSRGMRLESLVQSWLA